ncbi:MAG TPA: DNA polymerase III subunit delta [Steroidobacteraceae bacterium]|nr:DNA polymerase III subunit delta [Steroidobacteraceae bacterium]
MKLPGDKLAASLERGLGTAYLVTGDEPLLVGEACDAIRAAARSAGFAERELHFAERHFDWQDLEASTQTLSLFAERKILEVRLPGGSPGPEPGPSVLARLVEAGNTDTLLLVVAGRLDARALSAKWASAFDRHGTIVQIWPVDGPRLPAWIQGRFAAQGVTCEPEAAALIAERVEGNLLAARQEIDKLSLIAAGARLSVEDVVDAVADSARFDVLQIGEAAMRGDSARSLRILDGLRGEGHDATLVLWAINKDLQWLVRVARLVRAGQSPDAALAAERVWRPRQAAMKVALRRLDGPRLDALLEDAARCDRAIKGALRRDPWLELAALTARFAGTPLASVA